ncbi:uncharacterized protein FIBRA_05420 [Fibroporia radiculosa]|uniref:Uncharacterized protein n=1 Tax=Fibroporia radiculosa TaxID=599839 RepID=J4HXH5_9APHY|nr:uncharacterized protein FIBRA_05420 [Fibroporia radiculosa]CCM03292.1 predicted protein [Fibroporia radiculosa]
MLPDSLPAPVCGQCLVPGPALRKESAGMRVGRMPGIMGVLFSRAFVLRSDRGSAAPPATAYLALPGSQAAVQRTSTSTSTSTSTQRAGNLALSSKRGLLSRLHANAGGAHTRASGERERREDTGPGMA